MSGIPIEVNTVKESVGPHSCEAPVGPYCWQGYSTDEKPFGPEANCDQEAVVKSRILTAIRAANFVCLAQRVGADEHIINCALEGIANGAAVEIIQELGLTPSFVNLRRPLRTQNLDGRLHNL